MTDAPASLASMTGFARTEGSDGPLAWTWELRSVNARGLDLRFRLPPGFDALEPGLRDLAGKRLQRGTVNAALTLRQSDAPVLTADEATLEHVLRLARALAARIPGAPPPRAEALLALPGVLRQTTAEPATLAGCEDGLRAGFAAALDALLAARRAEGARLACVLAGQLDSLARLHQQASQEAATQPASQRARVLESLRVLLAEAPPLPEERIAGEVALLAARADVREELDRLAAHLQAARALLAQGAAVGRRLDFLAQELHREVNTLCSKSASLALTGIGLDLKAVLEQFREQVQNIE
jgi:uncharacterized protein (TIGR00255 family)